MSPAGLFRIESATPDLTALEERTPRHVFDGRTRTTELVIGERNLRAFIPAILELRLRSGQEDDLTMDPQYFIAANAQKNRRVAAVLIHQNQELEACVFFFEHCRLGMGLGLLRGGGSIGEGLVAGPEALSLALCGSSDSDIAATLANPWRKPRNDGTSARSTVSRSWGLRVNTGCSPKEKYSASSLWKTLTGRC